MLEGSIHSAGAVPSSLHQKLKFIVNNKLVVVSGEEELLVNKPFPIRYVEAAEESFETAFQALEIANATFVGDGAPSLKPKLSKAALMIAKVMTSKGYQAGSGLGKTEQGIDLMMHRHSPEGHMHCQKVCMAQYSPTACRRFAW